MTANVANIYSDAIRTTGEQSRFPSFLFSLCWVSKGERDKDRIFTKKSAKLVASKVQEERGGEL